MKGPRTVRVHLGGHLSWYDIQRRAWLELQPTTVLPGRPLDPAVPLTPADIARYLGLPRGEIALVAINGVVVDPDVARLAPDDRIEFYPPIGGG